MATLGGPALPVSVQTGQQQAGPAVPVAVVSDGRATQAGPAVPVYVVTSGPVQGGPAVPVVAAATGATVAGGPAMPVYVVSGSLGGATQTYTQKVLATQAANLIAYWPLNEAAGATADNAEGTAARDGTYTGVTLGATGIGDGNTAASFDGTTSRCNIFTASLNTAFNNQEGTAAIWFQMSGAGVWTDGANRVLLVLQADASNRVLLRKSSANNQLDCFYTAGGTAKQVNPATSTLAWAHLAITWSKSGDAVKVYLNGAQSGATQTGLGVWAGALNNAATVIGAATTTPTLVTSGSIAHAAVWTTPLSGAQIATLATV
jgi:hypothetical protein